MNNKAGKLNAPTGYATQRDSGARSTNKATVSSGTGFGAGAAAGDTSRKTTTDSPLPKTPVPVV